MPQTLEMLEGTWKEIAAHADQFTGRRLQVLIFPAADAANGTSPAASDATAPAKPRTLAEAFAGRIGRHSFEPTDLGARSEEYFAQIMDEKHAKDLKKRTD